MAEKLLDPILTLPSFASAFEWAVVRLATYKSSGGQGRLLFASISLLIPGRTPPPPMTGIEKCRVARNGGDIAFRRVTMTVPKALAWYRGLDAEALTPMPDRLDEIDNRYDGKHPFQVGNLLDQPTWPRLGLPMTSGLFSLGGDEDDLPPLLLGSKGISRLHRRFGNQTGFDTFLSDDDAVTGLERHIHINLKAYPEYIGSAVLLVPDPIIQRIENFMVPAQLGQGERIVYRILPHKGQSLNSLTMTFIDQTSDLLLKHEALPIPADGLIDMEVGLALDRYSYVISHPEQGVLRALPPTSFLRAINLNVSVRERETHVIVPATESAQSPLTRFTASRSQLVSRRTLQSAPVPENSNSRIATARRSRLIAKRASELEQTWFKEGDREAAMSFVRERIARARERVMIAEPYFGVLQLLQYLPAVSSAHVQIDILTSPLAFADNGSPSSLEPGVGKPIQAVRWNKIRDFQRGLAKLQQSTELTVAAKVMLGNPPMLHDRFLVIDDQVWFLGNSLNSLGMRGSMTIKVPDARPVLRQLEALLRKSEPFEAYFDTQKQLLENQT